MDAERCIPLVVSEVELDLIIGRQFIRNVRQTRANPVVDIRQRESTFQIAISFSSKILVLDYFEPQDGQY